MTIIRAIELLQAMLKKHGEIDVYFDCPKCGQAFAPNTLAASVTLKAEETKR